MDSLNGDRELIERILLEQTRIPYSHGDIQFETVFDRVKDRYLVMLVGWEGVRRVHGSLVHVDFNEGNFSIQLDGTEYGIACELIDAGIPKNRIVLAFNEPELRKDTEFALRVRHLQKSIAESVLEFIAVRRRWRRR